MFQLLSAESVTLFDPNSIWWFLQKGVLNIINGLEECFYVLAGVNSPFLGGETDPGLGATGENSLLYSFFTSASVTKIFLFFFIAATFLLGICLILSMIKGALSSEETGKALYSNVGKAGKGLMYMLGLPVLFLVSITGITVLMNFIATTMGGAISGGGNASIAQSLFTSAWSHPKGVDAPPWNTVTYTYLKNERVSEQYDYALGIFSGCLVVFAIMKVCIILVERFIDIMLLYFTGPFVLAKMPLDKEKSFEQWKEQTMVKFLSVGGIIICMYLYFLILPQVKTFLNIEKAPTTAKTFTLLLFIIGGAFAVSKGSVKVATLISAGAAQSEGMSAAETSRMMGGGTRMAIGGAMKVATGAVSAGIGGIASFAGARRAGIMNNNAIGSQMQTALPGMAGNAAVGGIGGSSNPKQAAKMAKQQRNAASNQARFMSGNTASSAAARGGVLGMLSYGAVRAATGAGKLAVKGGKGIKNMIDKAREKSAIKNGTLTPAMKRANRQQKHDTKAQKRDLLHQANMNRFGETKLRKQTEKGVGNNKYNQYMQNKYDKIDAVKANAEKQLKNKHMQGEAGQNYVDNVVNGYKNDLLNAYQQSKNTGLDRYIHQDNRQKLDALLAGQNPSQKPTAVPVEKPAEGAQS